MKSTLAIFSFSVFLFLSLLHFYWAAGGSWGLEGALPQKSNGEKVISVSKGWKSTLPTVLVGLALLIPALISLERGGWLYLAGGYSKIAGVTVSVILIIRAVGDFRYVGFFKTIKSTLFAKLDSQIYSPLCLLLAVTLLLLCY